MNNTIFGNYVIINLKYNNNHVFYYKIDLQILWNYLEELI